MISNYELDESSKSMNSTLHGVRPRSNRATVTGSLNLLRPALPGFTNSTPDLSLIHISGKMLANDRWRRLPGPETRQFRALLDLRHCPPGFGLYFLGGHGNLQRLLATFC